MLLGCDGEGDWWTDLAEVYSSEVFCPDGWTKIWNIIRIFEEQLIIEGSVELWLRVVSRLYSNECGSNEL